MSASGTLVETQGVRIAVEGCGHGTLNAIYATVGESCKARGWDGVDMVIIGGDFQAVRNAADLVVMSVPVKYREMGDFPDFYSGARSAPYFTVFIGGNHEASSHLWELYYGGWVAPNIYYLGAANVVRLGPLRLAALSGIWKGFDYRKPHHERLPFGPDEAKSFYHVRELDVRKLLLLQTQVDIGLSHDWPRAIEKHGDTKWLFRKKPFFRTESADGTLGNPAAAYVMDRLRPPHWFSAHLHIKYAAIKTYDDAALAEAASDNNGEANSAVTRDKEANPDEIELDDDGAGDDPSAQERPAKDDDNKPAEETNEVSDELRAQLPASFTRPDPKAKAARRIPGQPVPRAITNKQVRFLALDKCLPGRNFLQLCEIHPFNSKELSTHPPRQTNPRYRLQYDAEWLAITRVFHKTLTIGDESVQTPEDLGEEHYLPLIEAERAWVEENIVSKDKMEVPENFEVTAAPHVPGTPEIVEDQPEEYTNPQTVAFCALLGLENLWDDSAEERKARRERGAPSSQFRRGGRGGFDRGRGGRGRARARGGGRGRGR